MTGGSGFLGTHLTSALLADPDTEAVHVLDLRPPALSHSKLHYIEFDLRSGEAPPALGPIDVCIHLAALCKEPGHAWDEYFATNHGGTVTLCPLLEASGVARVIFTSTMMVFRAQEREMTEDSIAAPDTAYGISKLLAEKELAAWAARDPRRSLRVLRLGVVFGKGERGNFTRLYFALKRRRFAYIGKKTTVKGWVYVKDAVRCIRYFAAAGAGAVTYNVVHPGAATIEEICGTMTRTLNLPVCRIPTIPYRLALLAGYAGELASALGIRTSLHHRRIQKLYSSTHLVAGQLLASGFTPLYSLESALEDWRGDCAPDDLY